MMDICNRCHENEATITHSKRQRADGTWYKIKWCRSCQAAQVYRQKYNKIHPEIKEFKYSEEAARDSYLRLSQRAMGGAS